MNKSLLFALIALQTANAQSLTLPYAGSQANTSYPLFSITNTTASGLSTATAIQATSDHTTGRAIYASSQQGVGMEARSESGSAIFASCGAAATPSNTCVGAYVQTGGNVPNATALYAASGAGKAGRFVSLSGTGVTTEVTSGTAAWVRAGSGTALDVRSESGPAAKVFGSSTLYPSLRVESPTGTGIDVQSSSTFGPAVYVQASGNQNALVGVSIASNGADGVTGQSNNRNGVLGRSYSLGASGVYGENVSTGGLGGGGYGVAARASGGGIAIYGQILNVTSGWAAYFQGPVHVAGSLTSSNGKQFLIDHPLDPARKFLAHAAVESSELKNIYDGTVVLGTDGRARIPVPDWFEALNRDFRYQLTPIGSPASLFIEQELARGSFVIAGGQAGLKVSWQVTGNRQDAAAMAQPLVVERAKRPSEVGRYLRPELIGPNALPLVAAPSPLPAISAPLRAE